MDNVQGNVNQWTKENCVKNNSESAKSIAIQRASKGNKYRNL